MRDPTLYVPSHAGLWVHRKFRRLIRCLGCNELEAFGALHSLWHTAIAQAPSGVLVGWDAVDISVAARWPGDPALFVRALEAEGWLDLQADGRWAIHDWEEYAGEWRERREVRRERGKERTRRWRERLGSRDASQNVTNVTSVTEVGGDVAAAHGDTSDARLSVTPPTSDASPSPSDAQPVVTTPPVTGREERRGDLKILEREEFLDPSRARRQNPPTQAKIDRSRQNPDAPPPLPGRVVAVGGRRLGYQGVGFMENPADFPSSPAELCTKERDALSTRFPMLDGTAPRPSIEQAIIGKWPAYLRKRDRDGHAAAFAELCTWLSELAARHRRSWVEDGGTSTTTEDPKTKKLRARWRTRRARGEDLPPFHVWGARLEAEGNVDNELRGDTAPTTSDAPPPDLHELVQAAAAKARTGRRQNAAPNKAKRPTIDERGATHTMDGSDDENETADETARFSEGTKS